MMSTVELIALRGRLIAAYANRHTIGAAEAYVRALEAEVALADFNSRRGSVKHLLALVDAALDERRNLKRANQRRDFHYRTSQAIAVTPDVPAPVTLRGHREDDATIDEAAFSPVPPQPEIPPAQPEIAPPAPPAQETKQPKASRSKKARGGKPKAASEDA